MDDVSFIKLVEAVASTSKTLGEYVESQGNVNSSLTKKIDDMTEGFTKKTISTLNTRIEQLGTSTSSTASQLGQLNLTLGGVEKLIKSTNELTTKQTKVLESLDPGSRRLKGDTYDAQTGTEKRLRDRARRLESSGMSITKGLVTAGAGLGGYKLLSFLSQNKLPLAMLGLGGGMAPDWMTGKVGFREGLLGPDSWLRKNFAQPGGGGAANWMMDNPWWTLGGAGMVGTSLGRSALWGGTKLGAAGLGWGAGKLGTAAKWGLGGGMANMLNAESRWLGARNLINSGLTNRQFIPGSPSLGGQRAPSVWNRPRGPAMPMTPRGPTDMRMTPDSLKKIKNEIIGDRRLKRTFAKAAKDAVMRGGKAELAKRAGRIAAARLAQGIAVAGGSAGVGWPATIALWGYGIVEIVELLAEPVVEWWKDSYEEKLLKAREKMEERAIMAKDTGLTITGDDGRFLSEKEFLQQNVTPGDKRVVEFRSAGESAADQALRAPARRWLETLRDEDFEEYTKRDEAKNRLITKILAISDGKQFIGKTWSHKELYENSTLQELFGLYHNVVLPRALGKKGEDARRKAGYGEDTEGRKLTPTQRKAAIKGEAGMTLKGSRAEISKAKLKKMEDEFKTPEEIEEERVAAEKAAKAVKDKEFLRIGMGGDLSAGDWKKESEARIIRHREQLENMSLNNKRIEEQMIKNAQAAREHHEKLIEFLGTTEGQKPGAGAKWLESHPSISDGLRENRRQRRAGEVIYPHGT